MTRIRVVRALVTAALIQWGSREPTWAAAAEKGPVTQESRDESGHATSGRDEMEDLRVMLLDRDHVLLERDASAMAKKYARMARTPFAFFRATRWLAPDEPSAFLADAASRIALVGDPHPENVGIRSSSDGSRVMEFNDFDLATYGSYLDDLRRLAVATWIVGDMANLRRIQLERAIRELVAGYVMEVDDLRAGRSRSRPTLSPHVSGNLDSILVPTGGSDDLSKDQPASLAEAALARQAILFALQPELANSEEIRIKSVTRRNSGVASFALLRLHMNVERGSGTGHDERKFEIKESVAPSARTAAEIEAQFRDEASGHLRGWAVVDGREYHVRLLVDGARISGSRLAKAVEDGHWSEDQFDDLSASLGRLLAHGHCTARDSHGTPGVQALAKVTRSLTGLTNETVGYAHRSAVINKNRYHTFRRLLHDRGSLLGWTAPATPSPPKTLPAADTADQTGPSLD